MLGKGFELLGTQFSHVQMCVKRVSDERWKEGAKKSPKAFHVL